MIYTQTGKAVCNFSIPVSEKWVAQGGDNREKTTWYRVSIWGGQAESCNKFLRKGSTVLVCGNVEINQWEDQSSGETRSDLRLNAWQVKFIANWGKDAMSEPQQGYATQSQERARTATPPNPLDDIPF